MTNSGPTVIVTEAPLCASFREAGAARPQDHPVGADRIVDEKIFCFTHDCEIAWLPPV